MPDTQASNKPIARIRGLLMTTLVFSVFTNLLMFTGPLFMLQVYDRVLASRSEETLVALFALVAALYVFYWLIEYARGRVVSRVGVRIQDTVNSPVFRAVVSQAARRQPPGGGSLQDVDAVRNLFASPVMLALFDLPWTPVFMAAIFVFHPMLGWVSLGGGVVLIVVAVLNQVLTYSKTASAAGQARVAERLAQQSEASGEYVLAQGMRDALTERWSRLQGAAIEQSVRANDWTSSFSSFTKAFRLFLQSAILAIGAWYVLKGEMTAGAMIAASIMLGRALAPIDVGVSQWQVVQRARVGWKGIKSLLARHAESDPQTALPRPAAHLAVRGVSVIASKGDAPVLAQVSFEVKPGEALGVIGRSGSGKTTLARVLTGTLTPSTGEVRLAGATLEQYGPDQIGRYVGYLPQEVQFFDGTIAENIARMAVRPDAEKVIAAARQAQAHEIILKLPAGYDTPVTGAAVSLSGGQKQRLGLARALYDDPVLLVLDEPNAALDAEGSEALNRVVGAMKAEGKAVIIMTHRPIAISTCENLLVLEGGRVAGYGPREEIIKKLVRNPGDVQRVVQEAQT